MALQRLTKKQFLQHWTGLKRNQKLDPRPVPYSHTGSSYNEDSIRITGSREFIDSVLSRVSDLLEFESNNTRLDVNYTEVAGRSKDAQGRPIFSKDGTGTWVCYVKVAERGHEAKMANAIIASIAKG